MFDLNRKAEALSLIIILLKCFLILFIFGVFLPTLIDYALYYIYRSDYYDNSIFVNYIVDKNGKLLYNYIYTVKLLLGIKLL